MPYALLSELLADTIGLHFPRERWPALRRGLTGVARELGFATAAECAGSLLSGPLTRAQLQVLATHFTIGETYFFREKPTFEVLANHVLPELIRARRGQDQRLRLWSAACCSGEEAYSLAILLHQVLPDLAAWHVTILATDINPHFLRKGVAGAYGEWSFRDAAAGFRERYFHRMADGRHVVRPEIRKLVKFEHGNLIEDVYPSLVTDTNAMDLILCRNVLMYFTAAHARRVVEKLHRALTDGGVLATSPIEASQPLFSLFLTRRFPGVTFFQKGHAAGVESPATVPPSATEPMPPQAQTWTPLADSSRLTVEPATNLEPDVPEHAPLAVAVSLYEDGRFEAAADTLLASSGVPDPRACSVLARALANLGRLAESLAWCDRWIAADKMDPAAHYVRAMVLLERGDADGARRSLQRTLYLDPAFVLAHFGLGTLARSCGNDVEAERHFTHALPLLARLPQNDPLPESDGLTVGRLTETITAMTAHGR